MNLPFIIERLSANAAVFAAQCSSIDDAQAHWQPAPGKWSIVEVINHLYDEERDDFRARTRFILEQSPGKMPNIAPQQWAIERNYNARDLDESLNRFLMERQKSIEWLSDLKNPDWQLSVKHPALGKMTAEMVLVNWLAHDYLHIRQLNRLQREYFSAQFSGVSLAYAGDW